MSINQEDQTRLILEYFTMLYDHIVTKYQSFIHTKAAAEHHMFSPWQIKIWKTEVSSKGLDFSAKQ